MLTSHFAYNYENCYKVCGICGIVKRDREARVDGELLRSMNSTLVHRGPDDEGYYVNGPVGLAMRRLSIIDLDSGRQPMSNGDSSIWIVFNGEIYNYPELREDLIKRGRVFRTKSDTEVIVHLYDEYKERCVDKLNGMFAFAIWDDGAKRLLLVRDRLGIKPLYYSPGHGEIVFGSEIKSLIKGGVSTEPDFQAIYDYLSLMYIPTPKTGFKNIKALEPGHLLIWEGGETRIEHYWDVPLPESGSETGFGPRALEEVTELIQSAIKDQMIADVEVGALLSGGLDSTTVAAIMKSKLNAKLKTFTIGFEQRSYDESEDAALVAQTLDCEHIHETARPDMIDSMTDLLNHFDEPFADYSAIPTFLVSKIAAAHLKVTLTGDGGDEVFAGYPTHVAHKVSAIYNRVPSLLRAFLIEPIVRSLPTSFERLSFDYKAKRFVAAAGLPFGEAHYSWKVIFNDLEKRKLCSPEFLSLCDEGTYGRVFERHFLKSAHCHPINRLLYVDTKTFLLDDNLKKVDRMTMANSLEARVPFLDHRLVEKLAMIDPEAKTKGLETKTILRNIAKELLPPQISKGKKRGFTPPLPYWIKHELRGFVEDILAQPRVKDIGLLDPLYCKSLLDRHLSGQEDNNREIWTLAALICWAEKWNISL
jgi:asparagine synthase (glutamine-hydrolysing)